ncbi:hypothetical protein MmiHf6_08210 [Methanimicrococcus hongohii]|uniref:Proteinase inhibitor I42 chagasin domain-containing protein n=1 Tax=Methanimicrococcus hongohii TaxID=3028295 RepID=A0AA97A1T3_9EURY|nr:protease inhibitor I42 family protein [Methanimicrococcus sp. Hf6]WNY23513.1 hypothetical protein MmiHf6_08210 [Methanimicrococcus sp. Hf6]
MKKTTLFTIFIFLILEIGTSGCLLNDSNSFEPDNFTKTATISENNTTLTMLFDEDFNSDFRWELTMETEDVLKIAADEKIPTDKASQGIGKHQWIFEGNEKGITVLKFEYIRSGNRYTPEIYTYMIKNTEGELEILSFTSLSGNRTDNRPYTEGISVSEDKTLLTLDGQCVSSTGAGNNHWYLEKSQTDMLEIINQTSNHYETDPGYGWHSWEMKGQNSGDITLTMNYVNENLGNWIGIGLISEIVCDVYINENNKISIRKISYNSVKGEPVPYWDESL